MQIRKPALHARRPISSFVIDYIFPSMVLSSVAQRTDSELSKLHNPLVLAMMADESGTDIIELKKLDSAVTITVEEVPLSLSSKNNDDVSHGQTGLPSMHVYYPAFTKVTEKIKIDRGIDSVD